MSEVARLRAPIEAEHEASVWALTGLSTGTVKHAFIARRLRHMDIAHAGLSRLIGEESAVEILCQVFEGSPEQKH